MGLHLERNVPHPPQGRPVAGGPRRGRGALAQTHEKRSARAAHRAGARQGDERLRCRRQPDQEIPPVRDGAFGTRRGAGAAELPEFPLPCLRSAHRLHVAGVEGGFRHGDESHALRRRGGAVDGRRGAQDRRGDARRTGRPRRADQRGRQNRRRRPGRQRDRGCDVAADAQDDPQDPRR